MEKTLIESYKQALTYPLKPKESPANFFRALVEKEQKIVRATTFAHNTSTHSTKAKITNSHKYSNATLTKRFA